jgi:predicted branched-subunit amino acid permease
VGLRKSLADRRTIMIVNARYVLYGAAMRPWLASVSPLKCYGSLFILGDGNWILSMKAHADGERDVGFFLGSVLRCSLLGWSVR